MCVAFMWRLRRRNRLLQFLRSYLSVHCWNGHQLLVSLLQSSLSSSTSSSSPFSLSAKFFWLFPNGKGFKPKSSWEKTKGTVWKTKRREKVIKEESGKERRIERGNERTRSWRAIQKRSNIYIGALYFEKILNLDPFSW